MGVHPMLGTNVLSSFPFKVLSRGPYNEGYCTTEWRSCNWRLIYWKFLSSECYYTFRFLFNFISFSRGSTALPSSNGRMMAISSADWPGGADLQAWHTLIFLLNFIFIVDTVTDVPISPPPLSISTQAPHIFLFNPHPKICFYWLWGI